MPARRRREESGLAGARPRRVGRQRRHPRPRRPLWGWRGERASHRRTHASERAGAGQKGHASEAGTIPNEKSNPAACRRTCTSEPPGVGRGQALGCRARAEGWWCRRGRRPDSIPERPGSSAQAGPCPGALRGAALGRGLSLESGQGPARTDTFSPRTRFHSDKSPRRSRIGQPRAPCPQAAAPRPVTSAPHAWKNRGRPPACSCLKPHNRQRQTCPG